jgi:hypothetical protein
MTPAPKPFAFSCLAAALVAVAAAAAHAQIVIPPPGGTTVTWTDDGLNGQWQDADNWNVHVPAAGDAVIIDDGVHNVILGADAATIRSLFVAGGIGLYNNGHKLPVGNATNDATTTITGNGSTIIVSDIPGTGPALDTDYLNLFSGGELNMDGGRAQIDREVDMSGASSIEGHGLLEVGGSGDAVLGFSSTSELVVEGGNLRIDMTGGGTIAFGGAVIDVTDDNSDLIVEGNQYGSIGDTLRIGAGNTVDFQGPWEVAGQLRFVNGGGQLVGGSGELSGEVRVDTPSPTLMSGALHFANGGELQLQSLAELDVQGIVSAGSSHTTTLGNGSTLRLQLPLSAVVPGVPQINWQGDITANSANLEANFADVQGIVNFTGDLSLGGTAFWGPSDLQGTAPIYLGGNVAVSGAGARVNGVGVQFLSTSDTTIAAASRLEVHSTARVNVGATIAGGGELRVAQSGLLFAPDNAIVGVNVVNHGIVRPGAGTDYSAHFEFSEHYVQSETGVLEIDLAGSLSSQYDRLVVGHSATIDGTLAVTLRNGFQPAAGDDFLILSADDSLSGIFASTLLPALDEGLAWTIEYSPFAATLGVIEKIFTADADGSGIVDGADFLVIQRDMGKMVPCAGDITGDYVVDALDVAKWKMDYGTTVGAAAASAMASLGAVPEPGMIALAIPAIVALAAGSRRRRYGG